MRNSEIRTFEFHATFQTFVLECIWNFSKFFPRGSKITATSIKGGNFGISAVSGVQNSRRRVVILNQRDLDYNVTIFDKVTSKQIPIFLPKRSIVSVVWDK